MARLPLNTVVNYRSCGSCQACCTVVGVQELHKPHWTRCAHQCEVGCAIYEDRPRTCRGYSCLWAAGLLQGEEERRPDRLGIILDLRSASASDSVRPGDRVVIDQPLVSVETDKAVVEVPSPWSGQIARLFGGKGDLIKVGAPLVEFAEGERGDTGTVVGELGQEEKAPRAAEPPAPTPARTLQALPAVRALARKLDVDLNLVQASGPGGTITRADVERAAKSLAEAGPAEPLRGMRRAMAQRMAAAHTEVVRTTVTDEADIEDWQKGEDVTIRVVRAIAAACQAEPSLNAWYNAQAGERRLIKRIDIGIAVDTEGGLIVPVLRNVGERDARDLRAGIDRLRADAAARSIPPEELRGATITLSNFGMIGGRFANLIVVPPQVAIIGAGRIDRRVLVHNGAPAARRVLPLSLTVDHRVVTGGEAARFLVALKADLERAS